MSQKYTYLSAPGSERNPLPPCSEIFIHTRSRSNKGPRLVQKYTHARKLRRGEREERKKEEEEAVVFFGIYAITSSFVVCGSSNSDGSNNFSAIKEWRRVFGGSRRLSSCVCSKKGLGKDHANGANPVRPPHIDFACCAHTKPTTTTTQQWQQPVAVAVVVVAVK